jgi:hypothetical protein
MNLMEKRLLGLGCLLLLFALVFLSLPAEAVLEGSNRERMEFLDFSERMIRDGLYAKSGSSTFSSEKRSFLRGVRRQNEAHIYEPDVYTWHLAMEAHKKKLESIAPEGPVLVEGGVQPSSMVTGNEFALPSTLAERPAPMFNSTLPIIPPNSGSPQYQSGYYVQPYVEQSVTPGGQPYVVYSSPQMPPNAELIMEGMLDRAAVRGITQADQLQGESLRQKSRRGRRK